MIKLITVIVLSTNHGSHSKTMIDPKHIVALRIPKSGIGCAMSHKLSVDEIMLHDSCESVAEKIAALSVKNSVAKKSKDKLESMPWK